jgi:DegV family protein with EDD domain
MAGVRVITDSACDLPPEMAQAHGVHIVPLTVRFGDEELVDRQDLTPDQFWDRLARSPVLPETAAPSPGAFQEACYQAAEDGFDAVVCVTISALLSATHQAAEVAANAVKDDVPVRVIDSRTVTLAQGLIAVEAAKVAAEGGNLEKVAAAVEQMIPRSRTFAVLDSLEHLKRGGRIGGAKALLGSVLSIKPVIKVTGGKVEEESGRQRTRARALRYLAEKVHQMEPVENLAVMHGNAPDAEQFVGMLKATGEREVTVGDVGAVIGTHTGPGVMGVCFFTSS